jgi:hypothetical protein
MREIYRFLVCSLIYGNGFEAKIKEAAEVVSVKQATPEFDCSRHLMELAIIGAGECNDFISVGPKKISNFG